MEGHEHKRTQPAALCNFEAFQARCKCFYSKTKGGVDGSAQARAMLRSPSASFKWEQKVVGQTLKTLFVNAFIAYCLSERPELMENPCSFQNANFYGQNLNNVESLSDFCLEACTELLLFAETLRQRDQTVEESPAVVVNDSEITQLCELARKRKRNRLSFLTVWRECDCAYMSTAIAKSKCLQSSDVIYAV